MMSLSNIALFNVQSFRVLQEGGERLMFLNYNLLMLNYNY